MAEKIRALYVDDELTLLDLCKTYLERLGDFTVTTTTSAPEAIRILELARFDAIISDYQMSEMNGIEFLKYVRARGNTTPFIIFTGRGREEVVIEALNAGADGYLQKGGESKAQFAELAHKIRYAVSLRQTGADLRESEEKYRRFIETANEGIWQMDSQFAITFVNQKMAEMLGYTPEEMKGRNVSSFMHPDDLADHASRMKWQKKGRSDQYERRFIKKDGTHIWTIVSATALEDPDGTFKGSFAMFTDITERKEAEEALRKERDFANSVVGTAQAIILILDTDGHIVYMNPFMEGISGYMLEEVKGKDWFKTFLLSHTQERTRLLFRKAIGNTQTRGNVDVIVTKDGRERLIEWYDKTLKGAEGSIEGLLAIGQDITERRHAEEALKRNEERYRTVVEDQTEFICRFTPDGRLTFVNDAYCRYFSLNKDQCLTQPHTVVLPPEDVRQLKQHLALLTPQNPVATIEHRIIMPSGEIRWQRWNDRAIFDKDVHIVEYQSVGRDITETKNAEKTLRESEAYYRTIFENTGTASVIVEEDTTISLANAEFASLCGYSREEIEGKRRWTEFVVKEDLERMLAQHNLRRKDRNQAERHYEFRFVRKSGEIRTIFLSIDVISGTQKSIASLLDITEYKKAEQALRQSEEMHRLVLEFAGISSTLWTTDGHLLMINRYGAANLDGVPEDFLGKSMAELFGPEAGAVYLERIRQVAATGTRMEFEDHVPHPDGDRWFLSTHTCIKDAAGQAKRVMIFSHDITQRKIAELAYQDSADQLAFAIEGAHLGLWDINYTNRTISHNRYWHEILGYDSEETITPLDSWKPTIHPDDLPLIETISYDHLAGKTPLLDMEYRIRHKAGWWLWIHTIGRVVSRSAEGKPLRMSGINQDVTERKLSEETIRRSQEFLNKIIDTIGDPIYVKDREHRLVLVNDAACAIFGRSRDNLLGLTGYDLFPTREMADRSFERDEEVFLTGKDNISEETNTYAPGKTRTVLVRKSRYVDQYGKQFVVGISVDITDLRQTGVALRESESTIRALMNSPLDAVLLLDKDGIILDVNDTLAKRQGMTVEEMKGWCVYDLLPPDLAKSRRARIEEVGRTGKLIRFEDYLAGLWFDNSLYPIRDAEGNVVKIAIVARDITEYKHVEEALRESEERFRGVAERSSDMILLVDERATATYVSPSVEKIFGYLPREIVGKMAGDFIHPDDMSIVLEGINKNISGEPVGGITIRFRKKSGDYAIMEITTTPIMKKDMISGIQVIGRDITDNKNAEIALRERERQFRALSENSQDYIMRYDPEHRHIYANPACLRIAGMTAEQFIGKTHRELGFPPDLCACWESAIDQVFATGQPYGDIFPWTGVDGEVILDWRLFPEKDDGGTVVSVLGVARNISAIKATEQALRESEAWYRQFFATSRDSVFITTPEGKFVDFNDVILDLLGYRTREELAGVSIPDLYEDANVRTTFNTLIVQKGYVEDCPVRLKKKDGTIIDTLITTVSLKAEDDSVKAFFGTIRNVTEQKRAEEEIRTLQQFQQSVINNAKVWISVLDLKGTILIWNTTAEQISGYPAHDVIGKNTVWKQLYPDPVYRKQVAENILDVIKKNTYVENFETRIRTNSGDEKIIWWNTQPLRDASGKPVQFIAIGRDVTERRQTEERINALRQFEEGVIKNANIWISVLDGKGIVRVWNRAAEEISGYKAEEVIGKSTIWRQLYPDKEYRRTVTATITEIIGARKYLENFETRIRTKDGQERIIWWNTRALQDVPGIDETFIAIGKDVTETKTLSDAVTLANKKLHLLSSITRHDIVNQLSALDGYLDLSRDILGDPAKLEEYITKEQSIAKTIEALIRFTKDYQDMGIKAPEWQNVDESVIMAKGSLPLRGIAIVTDNPSLEVYADSLLVRVFYNLIDNALKYGGEQMTAIRISSQKSSHGLVIVWEDDGVGIPANKKEAIFSRGYFKHTGFGLFLSREILAITGIAIIENGTPGKGARFEITVPKGAWRIGDANRKGD